MNIVKLKERVQTFVTNPANYSNYGSELKCNALFYSYAYEVLPINSLHLLYKDEKYELCEFYDHNVDRLFDSSVMCKVNNFLVEFARIAKEEKLEYITFSLGNEETYIMTECGMIYTSYDVKTGILEGISIRALSSEDAEHLKDIIVRSFVLEDAKLMEKNHYKIAYVEDGMITTMTNEFDDWSTEIEKNYNDDVPYAEINKEIKTEKSSLILLYGKPGTGKSSIIKSIVNENLDTEFIYVDSSLFTSLSNGQFLSFLNDHKDSVFILEDCEKALSDRKKTHNEAINTILNITDGIVAESLKCKFICTFNCPLSDIDEALLRKGRLDVMYEFGDLTLEKTKVIYPDATKPMSLAEAYNATVKNEFGKRQVKKIGF